MEAIGVEYPCNLCEKVYQSKTALIKHHRDKHLDKLSTTAINEPTSNQVKLRCPMDDCERCFVNFNFLRGHLITGHGQQLEEKTMQFETMQDFSNWKSEEENNSICTYLLRNSAGKLLASGDKRYYYVCHRSFLNRRPPVEEEKLQRCRKSNGSCKVDRTCPSTMMTTVGSTIEVTFHSTHIGHTVEIGHQRLPKNIRMELAGKLGAGVTHKRIIDDVRECPPGTSVQRVHLIDKQDVRNIQKSFDISYKTKLHENDAISVRLWVQKLQALDDSPIVFYKEEGQSVNGLRDPDFLLIIMTQEQKEAILEYGGDKLCIDGTHGLNNYGFQLFTLLVVNSYGSGVPVAFCFAEREDVSTFIFIFNKIKEYVGLVSPRTFMSDDSPSFYNAWEHVMGPVNHQLLCTWHVQRSWSKNLSKITGPSEKKSEVFNTLKFLQRETDDVDFHVKYSEFMDNISSDPSTSKFAEYVSKYYSCRIEKWAYCYRRRLGINTNMFLESLHKKIKYSYLEGKRCKRMDKTIDSLMNLLRDSYFEDIIKFSKNKPSTKILNVRKSHRLAGEIKNVSFQVLETNLWSVGSTKSDQQYLVRRMKEKDTICPCNITCDACKICIHDMECECIDNAIRYNICKHIHIVCQNSPTPVRKENGKKQLHVILPTGITFADNTINADSLKYQATLDLLKGLGASVGNNKQCFETVMTHLNKALECVKENIPHFINIEEAHNGNIEPQIRFKPKRKKTNL